jgi:hypothetical protein
MTEAVSPLKKMLCVGPAKLSVAEGADVEAEMAEHFGGVIPTALHEAINARTRDAIIDCLHDLDAARGGDGSFTWVPVLVRDILNAEYIGKQIAGAGLDLLYAGTDRCHCCAGWRVIGLVGALAVCVAVILSQAAVIAAGQ